MTAIGPPPSLPAVQGTVRVYVHRDFDPAAILCPGLIPADSPDDADMLALPVDADAQFRRAAFRDPLRPVLFIGAGAELEELHSPDFSYANLKPALDEAIAIARRTSELRTMVRPETLVHGASALLAFAWTRGNRISPMFSSRLSRGFIYHAARALAVQADALPPDPVTLLAELARAGYLTSELVDIAHPCPDCGSINVLLRDGCPECTSIDLTDETLVHHFSCAFQAEESRFIGAHGIYTCPKCRKELRHFGLDYDKPGQIHICCGCNHRFQDARAFGRCLACDHRFAAEDSPRLRILDYVLTPEGAHALFGGTAAGDPIGTILGEPLPLLSLPLLNVLAQKMAAIEQRHNLHTLALVIDLTGIKSLPQGAGRELHFFVRFGRELAALVRSTDVVAYHLGKLILLLPGASLERGREVEQRLRNALASVFQQDVIDDAAFRFRNISDCLRSGLIDLR